MQDWRQLRIGLGHDTHRLGDGGPLRLGGVEIDFPQHLIGHSDADALLHAIIDALLGAAALGDIGQHFPNDDQRNKDRDSREMLAIVGDRVKEAGFELINLDCIIFAERPKLAPYRGQMVSAIASILGLDENRVGVKSKTGERVDAVGMGRAVSAQCAALLYQRNESSADGRSS